MATTSEVKAGLDAISVTIANAQRKAAQAKLAMTQVKDELAALPTVHSAVVTEVNAYTPTGAFETLAKDELAKLTTEFNVLKVAATTAETNLAGITEF